MIRARARKRTQVQAQCALVTGGLHANARDGRGASKTGVRVVCEFGLQHVYDLVRITNQSSPAQLPKPDSDPSLEAPLSSAVRRRRCAAARRAGSRHYARRRRAGPPASKTKLRHRLLQTAQQSGIGLKHFKNILIFERRSEKLPRIPHLHEPHPTSIDSHECPRDDCTGSTHTLTVANATRSAPYPPWPSLPRYTAHPPPRHR